MTHPRCFGVLRALTLLVGSAVAQTRSTAGSTQAAPEPTQGFVVTFEGSNPAGVLDGLLTIGTEGAWTGALTGSSYELPNVAEFGAVLYHYLTGAPGVDGPLTQGTVAVDVVLQTDPQDDVSGAGLLFDFQETTGDYFAFVATASGYALYRRDSDGLRALASESAEAVAPGTLRRLTARTAGSLVELYLDGVRARARDRGRHGRWRRDRGDRRRHLRVPRVRGPPTLAAAAQRFAARTSSGGVRRPGDRRAHVLQPGAKRLGAAPSDHTRPYVENP